MSIGMIRRTIEPLQEIPVRRLHQEAVLRPLRLRLEKAFLGPREAFLRPLRLRLQKAFLRPREAFLRPLRLRLQKAFLRLKEALLRPLRLRLQKAFLRLQEALLRPMSLRLQESSSGAPVLSQWSCGKVLTPHITKGLPCMATRKRLPRMTRLRENQALGIQAGGRPGSWQLFRKSVPGRDLTRGDLPF